MRRALAAGFALAFLATSAAAEDGPSAELTSLSLEQLAEVQVVYAASRYDQLAVDAPASVTVVTAEEIERFGARTLGEVLDRVRGLYVTGDRNYTYLGIRGFGEPGDENRRLLLMVNGHRLNEPGFDAAPLGVDFPVPLDAIERIEVIRGPGSSVYGSNALFGVVNVVTRDVSSAGVTRLRMGGGSAHSTDGSAEFSHALGAEGALHAAGAWLGSRGADFHYTEFDDGSPGAGRAKSLDGVRSGSGYARLLWRGLEVQSSYSSTRKDVPTAPYGTLFGIRTRTWDYHGFVDAAWRPTLGDSSSVELRGSANLADYDGEYPYDHSNTGTPVSLFRDYSRARWFTGSAQLTTRALSGHAVVGGVEGRADTRLDQGAYDELGVYTDVRRSASTWGVFAQDDWALSGWLRSSLGIRYDRHESFGGQFTPRAGVVISPALATRVKLLYGRAFRAPNPYELYYEGGGNKAAYSLSPELVNTYELALEQGLGARVSLSASIFRFEAHDLLAQELDPADSLIVFRNAGRVRAEGAEVELRARPADGWELSGSYGWQDARDAITDQEMVNSPRHLVKAAVTTPSWKGCDAAFAVRGVGRRGTLAGGAAPPYLRIDASARQQLFSGRFVLGLAVWNLADQDYADPGAEQHVQDIIAQDGRSWRAFLSTRLAR